MAHLRRVLSALALLITANLPAPAAAEEGYRFHTKIARFADVREDLRDAIIGKGLVIDHVGEMNATLERTAEVAAGLAPGAAKTPYKDAVYFQFCPAALTHEAVRASPFAIANCPIAVFAFETVAEPGKVTVGYRLPVATPSPEMAKVSERFVQLLDEIARTATKP